VFHLARLGLLNTFCNPPPTYPSLLERQVLNDIFPFTHIATGDDDFEIINHLAYW
jgi:hypothetical protein